MANPADDGAASAGTGTADTKRTKERVCALLDEAKAGYHTKRVPKGVMLVWDLEPHPNAYFVSEGRIEICAVDREGRKKTLDYCEQGGFFGFQIFSESCTPIAAACACEDSEVLVIPKASFYQALHSVPAFVDMVMGYCYGLLAAQTGTAVATAFYSSAQRTALFLLEAVRRQEAEGTRSGGDPLLIRHGNAEIASILGVSRNSVTTSLTRLQEQGVVKKERGSVRVVDVEKLKRIVRMEARG